MCHPKASQFLMQKASLILPKFSLSIYHTFFEKKKYLLKFFLLEQKKIKSTLLKKLIDNREKINLITRINFL
jgi:hypothetical protein